ncbi:class I SAM-dependent methyltransferase [Pseudonocardiaceae bacterium YIM PH 21723]|nr:class I SAM-dependent methyltransferase [Pseudonocardiaceae bacterium YIM PH 21723]
MAIDLKRAQSFGEQAQRYQRMRPGYPAALIHRVLPGPHLRIADVGAGTGKLSAVLSAMGHTVTAVEPDDRMRAAFADHHPAIELRAGVAEELPLPDGTVDAVLFGQSWHWADPGPATREACRVLTARGRLSMLWNLPDLRESWVQELIDITHAQFGRRVEGDPAVLAGFEPGAKTSVDWVQRLPAEDVIEMVATWSKVATLPEEQRAVTLDAVRRVITGHPDLAGSSEIAFPYVCTAITYRRES